jgi:hypothetical protein
MKSLGVLKPREGKLRRKWLPREAIGGEDSVQGNGAEE